MKAKTIKKIDKYESEQDAVNYVRFTMACEGMPLTKRESDRLRDCASGKLTVDNEVAKLVEQYKRAAV
jgi:hypothetical protein